MDILILATHDCSHCQNFSHELDDIGIKHEVLYCEDEPELVKQYAIRHSPNLIVEGEVVFREQPTENELKSYFGV